MVPQDFLTGRQLANYRMERLLGQGGMASVYYGWDVKLQRPVAIKVIDARYRGNPAYAERFVREARIVAGWRHPNILQIYYADNEDDVYYYVMEYIRGLDLGQLLKGYHQAGELVRHEDVMRIGRAVANALDYAHEKGVIHRDIKPSNVMVSEDGRVMLTDFGLAMDVERGTMGEVFGSPQYIAPEQVRSSANAVPQSDLYALGVMLYEMLTGEVPFNDPSPTTLAFQHMTLEPPPPRNVNPALSPAVEAVLLRALKKTPQERYPTGRALMDALDEALRQPYSPEASMTDATLPAPPEEMRPAPAISQESVAEKVARNLEPSATEQPAGGPASVEGAATPRPAPRRKLPWWAIGCGALLLVGLAALAVGAAVALTQNQRRVGGPTPSRTAVVSALGTAGAVTLGTPAPLTTGAAGTPDTQETVAGVGSTSPAPTDTRPPPESARGNLVVLYYDDASFYALNLTGEDRSINPISFVRLSKEGAPLRTFEGWRWGEIYPKFRNGYCVVIQVLGQKKYLEPEECKNKHLVVRTPSEGEDTIFWSKGKDSQEFQVLWDGAEVGRCKVGKGVCKVYLP